MLNLQKFFDEYVPEDGRYFSLSLLAACGCLDSCHLITEPPKACSLFRKSEISTGSLNTLSSHPHRAVQIPCQLANVISRLLHCLPAILPDYQLGVRFMFVSGYSRERL